MTARPSGSHMSLPNPPSSRSTPARTSTAATVPPYQPSGLDAFSNADEEDDWSEPSGSALDKFATEAEGAGRQSPPPPVARQADASGVGARLSPVAAFSPFQPESRLTTTS